MRVPKVQGFPPGSRISQVKGQSRIHDPTTEREHRKHRVVDFFRANGQGAQGSSFFARTPIVGSFVFVCPFCPDSLPVQARNKGKREVTPTSIVLLSFASPLVWSPSLPDQG